MKAATILASFSAALVSVQAGHTGRMTYYLGDNLFGACGSALPAGGNYIAVSSSIFSQSKCGNTINVVLNGKTVTGTVLDSCPGCGPEDVDVSEGMFVALAGSTDLGTTQVSWSSNAGW